MDTSEDRSSPTNELDDPAAVLKAIDALGAWKRAATHNWALESRLSVEPFLVTVVLEKEDSPIRARLLLFPGFAPFREFLIWRRVPDFGVATSPLDFLHYEGVVLRGGECDVCFYRPGYLPTRLAAADRPLFATLLRECCGLFMRFEDEPNLAARYAAENALFSRREGLDGKWRDAPFKIPPEEPYTEKVSFSKSDCDLAMKLPVAANESWEADCFAVPACHTADVPPRILYVLAAVDAATRERRAWVRMSVQPGAEDGLKKLWEGLAGRLLSVFLKAGHVPGTINVRTGRMARFVRPLGLQLPFKLVQHQNLPALEAEVARAAREKRF